MGMIRVLDSTGHGQLDYDPDVKADVDRARRRFSDLQGTGLQALVVDEEGGPARSTGELVPSAFEHVFLPQLVGG